MGDSEVVLFNNCHNRPHSELFGSGAFFDLATTGKQGTQALDLVRGQLCVVLSRPQPDRLTFEWYSFLRERPDPTNARNRVMFGKFLTSESMRPAKAVCDKRYADFFDKNGNIKIGSVFRTRISDKGLVTVVSDGGDEAAPSKRKRRGRRQGFQVDRMLRPQLEKYGMDRARAFFKSEQYVCEDHSASNPYDLLCTKRRKTLYVEVKGEVDHARNHKGKFLLSPLRGWGGLGAIAFRQLALAATCCRRFAAGGRIGVPGFVGSFGGRFAAGEDGMAGVDWWRGEVGL